MKKELEQLIGKCRNRIAAIGIELEGGWTVLPPGTQLAHDGSVFDHNKRIPPGVKYVGELPSRPMAPKEWEAWVKKYYPQAADDICGLHVHMSFKSSRHYQILLCREYGLAVLAHLKKWAKTRGFKEDHPIWPRLAGRNNYCRNKFFGDFQAKTKGKSYEREQEPNRYTVVNYCYALHSTVEIRVLPMFDKVDDATEAIREVLRLTNAFLVYNGAARDEKVDFSATVEDHMTINEREEINSCV